MGHLCDGAKIIARSRCGYLCLLIYFEKFFIVIVILYYTKNNVSTLINQQFVERGI